MRKYSIVSLRGTLIIDHQKLLFAGLSPFGAQGKLPWRLRNLTTLLKQCQGSSPLTTWVKKVIKHYRRIDSQNEAILFINKKKYFAKRSVPWTCCWWLTIVAQMTGKTPEWRKMWAVDAIFKKFILKDLYCVIVAKLTIAPCVGIFKGWSKICSEDG